MNNRTETFEATANLFTAAIANVSDRIAAGNPGRAGNAAALAAHYAFVLNPELRPSLRDKAVVSAFPCRACNDAGSCSVCRTL
jgi:hypothetical protein